MLYYFRIGKVTIALESGLPLTPGALSALFMTEPCDASLRYRLRFSKTPEECLQPATEPVYESHGFFIYERQGTFVKCSHAACGNAPKSCKNSSLQQSYPLGECVFTYRTGEGEYEICGREYVLRHAGDALLRDYLWLEQGYLANNGSYLHASLVQSAFGGIAFSGNSGAGKSTLAGFWQEEYGGEVLNGDQTLVFLDDAGAYGFGSPHCGSSGIIKNAGCALKAIVMLHGQGERRLQRASVSEAVRLLMPQMLWCPWDEQYMERLLDFVAGLAASVPVYLLPERPEKDGLALLYEALRQSNDASGV